MNKISHFVSSDKIIKNFGKIISKMGQVLKEKNISKKQIRKGSQSSKDAT
ncbi:hypothetical protein [Anaerococcus hydrogenalis]|nr:hypothetical protein [Anaerococcus hydrogenalis]